MCASTRTDGPDLRPPWRVRWSHGWALSLALALAACGGPPAVSSTASSDAAGNLASSAGGAAGAPAAARPLSFALVGDMPYSPGEVRVVDTLIADVNADPDVAFVLHVGDIKGGGEPCSNTLLAARHQQIQTFLAPVVYTPGDNEWTDCHRASNGRHVPTERLAHLRKLFFADPARSGGQRPMPVISQARQKGFETFVENAMFVRADVVFATVHIVGSNNNMDPWIGLPQADTAARPRADRLAEVKAREAAALAWIDRAFELAGTLKARGVVLAFQANPFFERAAGSAERVGFDALIARMKTRAQSFGGPVALLHGDRHLFIHDRPFLRSGEPAPQVGHVVRVQTYGSPLLHWVKLTVDPNRPELFVVQPRTTSPSR